MPEPSEEAAAWQARVLDAAITGQACAPPAAFQDACREWLAELPPPAAAVGVGGVPEDWADTLGWAGMPLAAGPLRWGSDVRQDAVAAPEIRRDCLLLPTQDDLVQLTSLSLKPLRQYIAQRLGCRLQAAPGIRLWLWPDRAVLLSLAPMPLSGFIYGPTQGHRAGVALPPWGSQIVAW
jgi:hypothetical protein